MGPFTDIAAFKKGIADNYPAASAVFNPDVEAELQKFFGDGGSIIVTDGPSPKIQLNKTGAIVTDLTPYPSISNFISAAEATLSAPAATQQQPAPASAGTTPKGNDEGNFLTKNINSILLALIAGGIAFFTGGQIIGVIGSLMVTAAAFFVGKSFMKLDDPAPGAQPKPGATPGTQPQANAGAAQNQAQGTAAQGAAAGQGAGGAPDTGNTQGAGGAAAGNNPGGPAPNTNQPANPGTPPSTGAPPAAAGTNTQPAVTNPATGNPPGGPAQNAPANQNTSDEKKRQAEEDAAIRASVMSIRVGGVVRNVVEPVDGIVSMPFNDALVQQSQAIKMNGADGKPIVIDGYFHRVGDERFYTLTGVTRFDENKNHPENNGARRDIKTGNAVLQSFPTGLRFPVNDYGLDLDAARQDILKASTPLIDQLDGNTKKASDDQKIRDAAAKSLKETNRLEQLKVKPHIEISSSQNVGDGKLHLVKGTMAWVDGNNHEHSYQFSGSFTERKNQYAAGDITVTELYNIDDRKNPSANLINNKPITITVAKNTDDGGYRPSPALTPFTKKLKAAMEEGAIQAGQAPENARKALFDAVKDPKKHPSIDRYIENAAKYGVLNATDSHGNTALMLASGGRGFVNIVDQLLIAGADVTVRQKAMQEGMPSTALERAVHKKQEAVVERLLQAKDIDSKSAIAWAKQYHHDKNQTIMNMLEAHAEPEKVQARLAAEAKKAAEKAAAEKIAKAADKALAKKAAAEKSEPPKPEPQKKSPQNKDTSEALSELAETMMQVKAMRDPLGPVSLALTGKYMWDNAVTGELLNKVPGLPTKSDKSEDKSNKLKGKPGGPGQ